MPASGKGYSVLSEFVLELLEKTGREMWSGEIAHSAPPGMKPASIIPTLSNLYRKGLVDRVQYLHADGKFHFKYTIKDKNWRAVLIPDTSKTKSIPAFLLEYLAKEGPSTSKMILASGIPEYMAEGSISPALCDLAKKGWVERTQLKREGKHGKASWLYDLTQAGRDRLNSDQPFSFSNSFRKTRKQPKKVSPPKKTRITMVNAPKVTSEATPKEPEVSEEPRLIIGKYSFTIDEALFIYDQLTKLKERLK